MKKSVFVLFLLVIGVAGCNLPVPTLSPNSMETFVVLALTGTKMAADLDGLTKTAFAEETQAPMLTATQAEAEKTLTLQPSMTATLTATSTPSASAVATATMTPSRTATTASGVDKARLYSETVPDGTVFQPGQSFIKIWRLQNVGTTVWNTGYMLVFISGSQLNGPASVALPAMVSPGQIIELSVTLKAPSTLGDYTGYWALRSDKGKTFGIGTDGSSSFWVKIKVANATVTRTPTRTLTRTLTRTITTTPTRTLTRTVTMTPTRTHTPTLAVTGSATATFTATSTETPTPPPTETPTETPTPSETPTETPTPTPT